MLLFMTGVAALFVLCTVWCLSAKQPTLLMHKQPQTSVTARLVPAVVYSVLLHWREDLHAWVIRVGQGLFRVRDYLFPLALVITAAVTEPGFPLGSERVDRWLDGIGLIIALLGQGCRLLAVGSVHNIRRGGRNKHFAAAELIQDGFFAHTRNPLYLGNLLIAAGLVLIADSAAWFLVVLPLTVGMYCAMVLAEEAFLTARFGQTYLDYCQRVRRFLPAWTGLRSSLSGNGVDWRRALRKEARVFCAWVSFVFGLFMWEQWEGFGFAARRVEIVALALVWVITLGIASGGGWWLKHTPQA
jgi:protein-S-isoprenylcysteine O-methyltransferase Ste14